MWGNVVFNVYEIFFISYILSHLNVCIWNRTTQVKICGCELKPLNKSWNKRDRHTMLKVARFVCVLIETVRSHISIIIHIMGGEGPSAPDVSAEVPATRIAALLNESRLTSRVARCLWSFFFFNSVTLYLFIKFVNIFTLS